MPHDLGRVVLPDLVGKVQCEVLGGTARVFGELARQHRGGVRADDGALGKVLLHLGVELDLLLGLFGDRLDDQVGIAKRLVVGRGEDDAFGSLLDLRLERLDLLVGKLGAVRQTARVCGRIGLHGFERLEVDILPALELGLRAVDRALGTQPDLDVEALVG